MRIPSFAYVPSFYLEHIGKSHEKSRHEQSSRGKMLKHCWLYGFIHMYLVDHDFPTSMSLMVEVIDAGEIGQI